MPAFKALRRTSLYLAVLITSILLVSIPGYAKGATPQSVSGTILVNLVFNYGNGTIEWHNGTLVPSDWNFFNVTVLDANGNVGAVYYASFGSHFVYTINGVGCATVFGCDKTWILWTLTGVCWDVAQTGADQIMVSGGATVGWIFGSVDTFGEVTPTLVNCINTQIDVKPGDNANIIPLQSQGTIPVAILTTSQLDASTVDTGTVRFGRTGTEAATIKWSLADVNGDGRLDLVLHFKTQETSIQPSDTTATLMGKTSTGIPFRGSDIIHPFLRSGGSLGRIL